MWSTLGISATRPLAFYSLIRVIATGGASFHHLAPLRCGATVYSRRCFTSNMNGQGGDKEEAGDGQPGVAEKHVVEHVEGESLPVKSLWGSSRSKMTDKQRGNADDAIARLFQDGAQRKALRQKPGRTLGVQTTSSVITTLPDDDMPVDLQDEQHSSLVSVTALEQELLDDDFLYFPSATHVVEGGASAEAAEAMYVPGQQIIPPGFTRYRVDVQYQGSDFDGWWKSTSHKLLRQEKSSDGSVRRVVVPTTNSAENSGGPSPGETMSSRYHAKTVLEEALAVALDVNSVKVVAGVIPEVGVSVRRLRCHVDVPSHIELQPRTIIQRATMWLEKRQQPLAILCCHRCKNQDFHARHSGLRRIYVYRILNRVAPPLFDAGFQWHVDRHLDVNRMQRFCKALEGTKDFGYFADPKMANALRRAAASPCGLSTGADINEHYKATSTGESLHATHGKAPKVTLEKGASNLDRAAALPTFNEYGQRVVKPGARAKEYYRAATNLPTIRTIDRLDVVRQDDEVLIWFVGQSFLRHQIRNMVSVLKAVGHGLWDELELQQALQSGFEPSRKRFQRERFPAAPVYGLTLWDVEYPKQHRDDYVSFVDSGPYEEVNIARDI